VVTEPSHLVPGDGVANTAHSFQDARTNFAAQIMNMNFNRIAINAAVPT
jgi:hypothetical protein